MASFRQVALARRLHLIAVGVVLALAYVFAGILLSETIRMILTAGHPAWLPLSQGERQIVRVIRPDSPAAGVLRLGDEVVAIDGIGVTPGFEAQDYFAARPPGPYRVLVRREGRLLEFNLETVPYGMSYASFFLLGFPAVQALFLAAGTLVFLLRPRGLAPLLLAACFVLFSFGGSQLFDFVTLGTWQQLVVLAGYCVGSFFWPVFLHLFLVFPEPSPLLRRWPGLARWVYAPGFGILGAVLIGARLTLANPQAGTAFFADDAGFMAVVRGIVVLYSGACLASLALSYREAGPVSRRRLRILVAGSVAGLLPFVLLMLVGLLSHIRALGLWPSRVLLISVIVSLPLVPLSFAYAIVKHQVMPLRLLLRRSLRYLLVARGIVILEAVEVALVLAFLILGPPARVLERLPWSAAALLTMGATALALAALVKLHRSVMPRINRRFFRDSYDTQRILAEIGQSAREATHAEEVLRAGLDRVKAALHPESAGVFLRSEESGHYLLATGEEAGSAVLRSDSPLIARLRRAPLGLDSERDGILLPIAAKADVIGVLSLGPRLGDLPYAREDRQLLAAVTWQMAFAIENTRLIQRRAEEERLRRELQLAGEVQRRLFPARPPRTRRLELAGLCLPAQDIGGDYYDFLIEEEGRVGIAVADVAGKGISAALLMSVVQASLRSQYGGVPLSELVASMNQLLYRSSAPNSFASFFLAQFDETSGRLSYVNAGHNPPLLVRHERAPADSEEATGRATSGTAGALALHGTATATLAPKATLHRLRTGGMVIGARAGEIYEVESVQLEVGDLLVAFTDGVTEAFDPEDREFGEERLQRVVLESSELAPAAVAERIVAAVREFVCEAPQHDDVTLVVARVTA